MILPAPAVQATTQPHTRVQPMWRCAKCQPRQRNRRLLLQVLHDLTACSSPFLLLPAATANKRGKGAGKLPASRKGPKGTLRAACNPVFDNQAFGGCEVGRTNIYGQMWTVTFTLIGHHSQRWRGEDVARMPAVQASGGECREISSAHATPFGFVERNC